ncbi:hypothetical protein F5Y19DRAFT_489597 [Xylariaceae sp. FL1651]|nr:hypothetical protein F5Y19DRAFT_489597 [Xylariaceae sp. FL1651]
MTTPSVPQKKEGTKSESPTDDEKALVRASANFGSLTDPFSPAPVIPQSVAPTDTFATKPPTLPLPTPSRRSSAHPRLLTTQSTGRYRATSAAPNNAAYGPGLNPSGAGNSRVFSLIMTATQYVHISPGMSSQVQMQLSHLLQEISQGFSAVTVQLRQQRDAANKARGDEQERCNRAVADAEVIRNTVEELRKVQKGLEIKLSLAEEREGLLNTHVNDLKKQIGMTQQHLDTLNSDASRFQAHHNKVVRDFQIQDEAHIRTIKRLENELKELRVHYNHPNAIESRHENYIADSEHSRFDNAAQKPKLTDKDTAMLLDGLKRSVHRKPSHMNFVPNPQAPAWAPVEHNQPQINPSLTTEGGHDATTSDKTGNSGELILYSGRGTSGQKKQRDNKNKSVAHPVRQGPPPSIRTPFGVVLGGYPTVEENSRLPGNKLIPRDKEEWDTVDIQRAIAHLYDICKGYVASCHVRGPPNIPYDKLQKKEPYTWLYLMQQVYKDPDHASGHLSYLFGVKQYAPFIIQRTCVDYMLKKILTPQVFLGFSDQMDGHLSALQTQIAAIAESRERVSRPRQRVIEDHARLIRAIASSEGINEFRNNTIERHVNIVTAMLDSLRSQGVSVITAQKSLRIMFTACWDISIKIWGSGQTLHYVFPECATKFAAGTMEALNGHHIAKTTEELINSQCRVSLVVTPTMTLRDDRDSARMQCHAIHKAQVLVMK